MSTLSAEYLDLLQRWLPFGAEAIYRPSFDPETACYGPGNHGHWSIQTNATVFAGLAVLASDPRLDPGTVGMSPADLRELSLKLLRFMLRSHVSGSGATYDGQPWGNSWISCLASERMMHGIEALGEHLAEHDRQLLRRMLAHECDWLVDELEVVAAIDATTGRNKPESNIWNGAVLHRIAMMFPELPRCDEYRHKGTRFLLNGISLPADAGSAQPFDGQPLSYWHVGPNFTEDFGLHHHGYLNVGYMVICLSNLAMLHFSYKARGISAPPALYLHAEELWQRVKAFTFPDGRLLRIGGDTRVRYCYCQDYAIPAWLLALDAFGDRDVIDFEKGWLDSVATEQQANGDGSFLGQRLAELESVSPLYYHRLEGDRVATLSMGAYWRRIYEEFSRVEPKPVTPPSAWHDAFHGAALVRSEQRIASFSWQAAQRPGALCLPTDHSTMAEWSWNLIGKIEGCSAYNHLKPTFHTEQVLEGGFHTYGEGDWWSVNHIAEGQADEPIARHWLAFAALPDDRTVIVMQRARTISRAYIRTVKGLFLNLPNDLYNASTRRYTWGGAVHTLASLPAAPERLATGARTLTIDDALTVSLGYGAEELVIHRPARRQIQIYDFKRPTYGRSGGNLYCDEICAPCLTERHAYEADTTMIDVGFVVAIGSDAPELLETRSEGERRTMTVRGADGVRYTFTADFQQQRSCLESTD